MTDELLDSEGVEDLGTTRPASAPVTTLLLVCFFTLLKTNSKT